MRNLLFLPFLVFLLSNCSYNESGADSAKQMGNADFAYEENADREYTESEEFDAPEEIKLEKGSKIIKNGRLQFEVDDLKEAKLKVDRLIANMQSYYENEQYNTYGESFSYSLTIRVPHLQFDSLIHLLEAGDSRLMSKNVSAKDVTEEYVDLNIRLQNNTAYLAQYKEILKKARSVKDILEVQEKIRRIEEEIDSKKGRLQFLDDQVKFSTLHLELTEYHYESYQERTFLGRIGKAFSNGYRLFLDFLLVLINLWPFIILFVGVWVFRKRIFRRFWRRKPKA